MTIYCLFRLFHFSGHNDLSGAIPASIGRLSSSLQHLDLSGYELSGLLPASLAELHMLEKLDLSENKLSTVDYRLEKALQGLTAIKELNLSKNQFNGSLPNCIARFNRLTFLDVSSNFFEGPVPLGFITLQQRSRDTSLCIAENSNIMFPKNIGLLGLGILEISLEGAGIRGSFLNTL